MTLLPPPAAFVHPFGLAEAVKRLGHRIDRPDSGVELLKSLRHVIVVSIFYEAPVIILRGTGGRAPRKQLASRSAAQKSAYVGLGPPVSWEDIRQLIDSSKVKLDLVDGALDRGPGVIPFGLTREKELWWERSRGGQGWWAAKDGTPLMDSGRINEHEILDEED
ncbi:hypothetical protein JAAARDRAFT_59584 [Jaapia argillacea MUCL 33604]|uniref:Uncharacterized protein n=1 Tax=Jaapia argillacea MUCL 33604 TaxID=933084 RepID=A0A067PP14_9AGAM|nr:hypothetical protein JAAARDRAFT_59584 [Jaapia argillacea MUCL 33604]